MPHPNDLANPEQVQTPTPKTPGDSDGKAPKYSDEDVEKKLRGQGKLIKKLEDQLAIFEAERAEREKADAEKKQKELAEQGKHKELYEREAEARKSVEQQLKELQEKETKRLEALTASLDKRIAALPKELRELVPAGLGPDAMAEQVTKLEGLGGAHGNQGGYSGAVRPGNHGALSPEQTAAKLKEQNLNHMLGRK